MRVTRLFVAAVLPIAAATLVPSQAVCARGPGSGEPPNILLICLDDVGVEKVSAYGEGPANVSSPCTPSIDRLAERGVLFRNAWANPLCSPTRAQLLTGRHGFRTGLGAAITSTSDRGLSVALEHTLPEVLSGYDGSAVGKWHLAALNEVAGNGQGLQHPLNSGFAFFAGSMSNLDRPAFPCGVGCVPQGCPPPRTYTNWVKTSDLQGIGFLEQACTQTYATTDTADEAILRAQSMQWPWFLYVSFNAAHSPIHDPPTCHTTGTCETQHCPSAPPQPKALRYNAMIEALDSELGRLLTEVYAVDPDVYVFLIGDNGTPPAAAQGPAGDCFSPSKVKGTLFEGGVNVPLIVSGPGVQPGEIKALVCATDLFATIAQLAGTTVGAEDSVSMLPYLFGDSTPLREMVYAESFTPNQDSPDHWSTPPFAPLTHARAIRDARFKLVRTTDSAGLVAEEFYDLRSDPCESFDLCPGGGPCSPAQLPPLAQEHYQRLRLELFALGVD